MIKIDVKNMMKAREYRSRGLKIREISRLMGKDPTQIHRWLHYKVDESYTQKVVDSKKKVVYNVNNS